MKNILSIIWKIIIAFIIIIISSCVFVKFINYIVSIDDIIVIIFSIIAIFISCAIMIFAVLKCFCKKKNQKDKIKNIEIQNSNKCNKKNKGITVFEIIYYIISIVFLIWFGFYFSAISESAIDMRFFIKCHIGWLIIYNLFLFISSLKLKLKFKRMIFIYTIINIIFIVNIIVNRLLLKSVTTELWEEVAYKELWRLIGKEIIIYLLGYPVTIFFYKEEKNNENIKVE